VTISQNKLQNKIKYGNSANNKNWG